MTETAWQPHLLNGTDAVFLTLRDMPGNLPDTAEEWFVRPVGDSKELPGKVISTGTLLRIARRVLALGEEEIPPGSLRHDTALMLTRPATILKE